MLFQLLNGSYLKSRGWAFFLILLPTSQGVNEWAAVQYLAAVWGRNTAMVSLVSKETKCKIKYTFCNVNPPRLKDCWEQFIKKLISVRSMIQQK